MERKFKFWMESPRGFKAETIVSLPSDFSDKEIQEECEEWAYNEAWENGIERYKFDWKTV